MALEKYTLTAAPEQAGIRLDHALAEWLPKVLGEPVSKAKVRGLIIGGGVYLNRKRVRIASKPLMVGARIEVILDRTKLRSTSLTEKKITFGEADVVFEDESLLVVNKPSGMPTQPTLDSSRNNLFDAVKKLRPESYIGLHHRLDRDTSGLVLFTKKKELNSAIADLFKDHGIQKEYQALVEIKPGQRLEKKWQVRNYLKTSKDRGKQNRVHSTQSGGDLAITDFSLLENFGSFAWIQALPRTGRMHQIRVHLSEMQRPIIGDPTYGGSIRMSGKEIPRVMLHAQALEFIHPLKKTSLRVEAPLPQDFKQWLQIIRDHR